jgi:hypothetical protein
MRTIDQNIYDVVEITVLAVGCLINLLTLLFVSIYTRKTYSIAQTTYETAAEAAKTAKITEEALEVSSRTLEEMRETRDAQTAPYVFVYFDQMKGESSTKIFLVIKNAGGGTARDVRIKFDPELQNDQTYSLKHIRRLTKHITSLPPEGEIRHAFAFKIKYFNAEPPLPMRYKVRATFYGGVKKDERVVEHMISLDSFVGLRVNRVEGKADG